MILPVRRFPEFLLGVNLGNRFLRFGKPSHGAITLYLNAIAVITILSACPLVVGIFSHHPIWNVDFDLADSNNHLTINSFYSADNFARRSQLFRLFVASTIPRLGARTLLARALRS